MAVRSDRRTFSGGLSTTYTKPYVDPRAARPSTRPAYVAQPTVQKPYVDPRSNRPTTRKAYVEPRPKQVVAEVDDDFISLASKLNIDVQDFVNNNKDVSSINAGAVYNVPEGKLSGYDQFWFDKYGYDTQVFEEPYFGGAGAPSEKTYGYETDFGFLNLPAGWQPGVFKDFQEGQYNINEEAFMKNFNTMDLARPPENYAAEQNIEQQYGYEKRQNPYYPSEILGPAGIPSYHKWGQDDSGEWQSRPPEAVFDELYRANGIDPNDPAAVEFFWSLADEDLLYMGEFFDVIEWPEGGGGYGSGSYGGYGGMPTPYRQYRSGSQPSRGNYASYLSLTSWSI